MGVRLKKVGISLLMGMVTAITNGNPQSTGIMWIGFYIIASIFQSIAIDDDMPKYNKVFKHSLWMAAIPVAVVLSYFFFFPKHATLSFGLTLMSNALILIIAVWGYLMAYITTAITGLLTVCWLTKTRTPEKPDEDAKPASADAVLTNASRESEPITNADQVLLLHRIMFTPTAQITKTFSLRLALVLSVLWLTGCVVLLLVELSQLPSGSECSINKPAFEIFYSSTKIFPVHVRHPHLGIVTFPSTMSRAEIVEALRRAVPPSYAPTNAMVEWDVPVPLENTHYYYRISLDAQKLFRISFYPSVAIFLCVSIGGLGIGWLIRGYKMTRK